MTNNIFARTSQEQRTNTISKSRKSETAETAGSLAMKSSEKSYLAMNTYDTISINSPYSLNIDFTNYSAPEGGSNTNSGFLSNFANAVAVIGTDCSGCAASVASAGTSSSCGGGGGFTSFV